MVKTLWLSEVLEKQKASSSFTSIAIIMTKTPLTHSADEEEDRMEWTICEKMIGKKFLASFQETDMFSKMTIFSLRWLPTVFWLMGKVGWVDWHPACLGHRFPPNQVALCCMYLVNPSSFYILISTDKLWLLWLIQMIIRAWWHPKSIPGRCIPM